MIDIHRADLLATRYAFNIGTFQYALKEGRMRWGNGKIKTSEVNRQIEALLGPRTEMDNVKKTSKKVADAAVIATSSGNIAASTAVDAAVLELSSRERDALVARDLKSADNSKELLDQHRIETNGKVRLLCTHFNFSTYSVSAVRY